MKCEGCGDDIHELRLIKWQVWDTLEQHIVTHRLWLCLTCWLEHGGELEAVPATLKHDSELEAVPAIQEKHDNN